MASPLTGWMALPVSSFTGRLGGISSRMSVAPRSVRGVGRLHLFRRMIPTIQVCIVVALCRNIMSSYFFCSCKIMSGPKWPTSKFLSFLSTHRPQGVPNLRARCLWRRRYQIQPASRGSLRARRNFLTQGKPLEVTEFLIFLCEIICYTSGIIPVGKHNHKKNYVARCLRARYLSPF